MSLLNEFRRVSRRAPCPICQKPDWCLVSCEGGDDPVAVLCRRVESPIQWKAGWLHRLRQTHGRPHRRVRSIKIPDRGLDLGDLARHFTSNCTEARRKYLATTLGVSTESLSRLGLGWDGRAFTVPMEDGLDCVRGIRRRFPSGDQRAIAGSKNGIFVPSGLTYSEPLLVCEGASDTAALLDLSFEAIGRADCQSARRNVRAQVSRKQPPAVVIVADNDSPGIRGAHELASAVALRCRSVRVISPPNGIKDARAWKALGATKLEVDEVIRQTPEVLIGARRCRIGGGR